MFRQEVTYTIRCRCKNYDDLRTDTMVPRILIVVLMPKDNADWLTQTEEELCLRQCAYWASLEGQPPTSNTASVTVQIPTSNIFSTKQLIDLMQKAERGEALC